MKEKEIIEYFLKRKRKDARLKALAFSLALFAAFLAGFLTHQLAGV